MLAWDKSNNDAKEGAGFTGQKGVDSFEDGVDAIVAVSANFPAFDNAGVVAVDEEVLFRINGASDGKDEEFEGNGFGPCDVSLAVSFLPSWEEPPGSPLGADDDAKADARASIRNGGDVDEGGRRIDGAGCSSREDSVEPPGEVFRNEFIRSVWEEGFFLPQTATMRSSPVRYAQPAGMSEAVCSDLPYSFLT